MWGVKKAYFIHFRVTVFNIGARLLPWRKPELQNAPDSIKKIPSLLKSSAFQSQWW